MQLKLLMVFKYNNSQNYDENIFFYFFILLLKTLSKQTLQVKIEVALVLKLNSFRLVTSI